MWFIFYKYKYIIYLIYRIKEMSFDEMFLDKIIFILINFDMLYFKII